jgi:DNA polymerase I-like protein with 3'-5' exonuclease and polymerase domains
VREAVFDLEADSKYWDQVTTVHCLVFGDLADNSLYAYHGDSLVQGLQDLSVYDRVYAHNGLRYDYRVLDRLYPGGLDGPARFDSIVLSRLVDPGIDGGHSLEAIGERLKFPKGDFGKTTDWAEFSEEMLEYCRQDVRVTMRHLQSLRDRAPWSFDDMHLASYIEHRFAESIGRIMDAGVCFDTKAAIAYADKLDARRNELLDQIRSLIPDRIEDTKTPAYYLAPTGETFTLKKDAPPKVRKLLIPGPFKQKAIEFNPASADQTAQYFVDKYNWKPQEFTKTGKPQVNDKVLASLPYQEAALVAQYKLANALVGKLVTAEGSYVNCTGPDGRIHGWIDHNGALTSRCTHSSPNLANIPTRTEMYAEVRKLFVPTPGWTFVGADAKGLELRMQAHFLAYYDGGAYIKVVTAGDPHKNNQVALGLPTKDLAKTWVYAHNYGGGDPKLGAIIGFQDDEAGRAAIRRDPKCAEMHMKRFFKKYGRKAPWYYGAWAVIGQESRGLYAKNITGFALLVEDVQERFRKHKALRLPDGRLVSPKGSHSALNTLFQGIGALAMKVATFLTEDYMEARGLRWGLDYHLVLHVHDEMQGEGRTEEIANELGLCMVQGIRDAGAMLKLACPLDAEYSTGSSWYDTH